MKNLLNHLIHTLKLTHHPTSVREPIQKYDRELTSPFHFSWHFINRLSKFTSEFTRQFSKTITILILISLIFGFPITSWGTEASTGEDLFIQHCAGCHIKGGNIIRRNKTLKLSALQRNGLDNPEAIARIARKGIGIMNGYEENLGEGGDQLVANWIWNQAQNAWFQG